MALRLRRGTDAERQQPGFIPESGELIYTTDTKLVYVGDGSTEGGLPISSGAFATTVESDLSPSLGGNLDLNNKNIVGTGEIGEVGTPITAIRSSLLATDTLSSETQPEVTLGSNLNLGGMDIVGIGNINIDGTVVATGTVIPGGGAGSDLNVGTLTATTVKTDVLSSNSSAVSLGNNLDLGANNIVGVGNINIDGTITATGNISLGDDASDVVDIPGSIGSNIIPQIDNFFNLGTDTLAWKAGHFSTVNADTVSASTITNSANEVIIDTGTKTLDINSIFVDYISGRDSSVVYDSATNTLTSFNVVASRVESASFEGTLTGSVLSSDNSLMIDSELKTVFADEVTTPTIGSPFGELRIRSLVPDSQTIALIETTGASTTGGEFLSASDTWQAFVFEAASSGTDIASGDVLGVISWAGVQDSTETSVANAMGVQADPAGVTSSTHIPTKYLFANQPAIEGNSPVLMSFDSLGRLAVNQENASATLDVNGYAKLAVLDTAPTSPQNGSVAIANGTGWDPLGTGAQQAVVYLDGAWTSLDTSVTKTVDDIAGTAYTVSATDLGKVLTFRDAGAVTVTLPDAASATIPVGAYVEIANMDATSPIAVAGTASQVVSKEAGAPSIPAFGSVRAIKLSSSEWLVTGDTA